VREAVGGLADALQAAAGAPDADDPVAADDELLDLDVEAVPVLWDSREDEPAPSRPRTPLPCGSAAGAPVDVVADVSSTAGMSPRPKRLVRRLDYLCFLTHREPP
jgi:hypothetical protein